MRKFDLRPSPQVLVALTYTSMKPIDALCELIDNAIDSFANANNSAGVNEIRIELPTQTELSKNEGAIRVFDNGPGMSAEEAEKALTAGESSQSAYGSLGLFGMGLNIAAGKFARKTRLITATSNSRHAIVVEVDIEKLVSQKHYGVQPTTKPKDMHFGKSARASGTIIELTGWWREGSPNRENPNRLIRHGPKKVRETLGRRYATLIRDNSLPKFKLIVKGDECVPFEHCVWDEKRFIKRGSTQIPAKQIFDEVLDTRPRCNNCGELAVDGKCPVDQSHAVSSVEERVRGWVGVQRYDDTSHFGIDLIRNGRAIRVLEQNAFFEFVNDDGDTIKDYPIDSIYGRIVGEVHLNHVKVDFTKQDFVRSTREWQEAIDFLRGTSSLQPRQPGADQNTSPVMKIFSGYRRVRKIGLDDMYMGEKAAGDKEAKRNRALEKDYLEKFRNKEPGYYDDAKWWEKVEEASREPDSIAKCSECDFQNPVGAEECSDCGHLLRAKDCTHCQKRIRLSASNCPHCGKSQVPEGPWACQVCGAKDNLPELDDCAKCGKPKGSVSTFATEVLLETSSKDNGLSVNGVEIELASGESSEKFDLEVRIVSLRDEQVHLPAVIEWAEVERKLLMFIDTAHPLFQGLQLRPEHAVSLEAAYVIRAESQVDMTTSSKHSHNVVTLQEKLLTKYWSSELSDDPEQVRDGINALLDDIRTKAVNCMQDIAEDVFADMSKHAMNYMVNSMRDADMDISQMDKWKKSGAYLRHTPPETIVSIFDNHPEKFFDGAVWDETWNIPGLPDANVKEAQEQLKETYLNCLEDVISFLRHNNPSRNTSRRARLSTELLQQKISA